MHVGGSDEKVCILQGSAATFPGAVDKFTILRAKKMYPGFYLPKIINRFIFTYSKYKNVIAF